MLNFFGRSLLKMYSLVSFLARTIFYFNFFTVSINGTNNNYVNNCFGPKPFEHFNRVIAGTIINFKLFQTLPLQKFKSWVSTYFLSRKSASVSSSLQLSLELSEADSSPDELPDKIITRGNCLVDYSRWIFGVRLWTVHFSIYILKY